MELPAERTCKTRRWIIFGPRSLNQASPQREIVYSSTGKAPSHRFSKLKFRIYLLIIFVTGVALAAIDWNGRLGGWLHPGMVKLLSDILPKIGDALMIAPLLASILEVAAATELLDQFIRDISLHIIGYRLPPLLREYIFGYFASSFVRTEWIIEYRISVWPDQPDYLQVKSTMEFKLENRSEGKQMYPYHHKLRRGVTTIGETQILRVRATLDDKKIFDSIEDNLPIDKSDMDHLTFAHDVEVKPQPHGIYKFTAESVECFPIHFYSTFHARVPVLKTVMCIYYPKEIIDVQLNVSFAEDLVLTKTTYSDRDEWVIDCPTLPGQGFTTSWKRING